MTRKVVDAQKQPSVLLPLADWWIRNFDLWFFEERVVFSTVFFLSLSYKWELNVSDSYVCNFNKRWIIARTHTYKRKYVELQWTSYIFFTLQLFDAFPYIAGDEFVICKFHFLLPTSFTTIDSILIKRLTFVTSQYRLVSHVASCVGVTWLFSVIVIENQTKIVWMKINLAMFVY